MAKKSIPPIIPPDQQKEILGAIADLKQLLGRLDQFQACGVDCDGFRLMAHELVDNLTNIVKYVINNEPLPVS